MHPIPVDKHNDLKNVYQTKVDLNLINADLKKLLKDCNIYVGYIESFYSKPHNVQPIHTDNEGGDYVKLNYVYGGTGSLMHWYKMKSNVIPNKVGLTKIKNPYIPWRPSDVELIESAVVGFPSLIQVGCPHNVTNAKEHRLCISLVLWDPVIGRITMKDACDRLSNFTI
jgi:hypothetical protein